jgi:hypothetical protein
MEARFAVRVDGQRVLCRVSWEAITDHLGDPLTESECLGAVQAHFDEITDKVGHKIATGRFEPDGSVLLRTGDW